MRGLVSFTVILLGLTAGQLSTAATLAVDLVGSGLQNGSPVNVTIGWGFTLSTPMTVTDLGYFAGNSGLVDPHPVGIWDSVGNLLATGTVPSGTGGSLVSGFRFAAITPVILGVGAYTIGGFDTGTSSDQFLFSVQSVTPIAGLSFGPGTLFINANSLTRPTTPVPEFGMNGFFGPNFLVGTSTAIPEPGAIGTTLLGLALVLRILIRPARSQGDCRRSSIV
jgi:Domain of unknown function (DUF4082)